METARETAPGKEVPIPDSPIDVASVSESSEDDIGEKEETVEEFKRQVTHSTDIIGKICTN